MRQAGGRLREGAARTDGTAGDPTPSKEDIEITRRLREAGEMMAVRFPPWRLSCLWRNVDGGGFVGC